MSGCGALSGGVNAALTGSLVPSTNLLSFGSVQVGQTVSSTVSLKNASANAVQISQINISGTSFGVGSLPSLPITIAGGATYAVILKFTPSAAGTATGDLTLISTSTTGNPRVALSGTGMTSSSSASTQATMISPTSGSVLPGSSATFVWTAGTGVTGYQLWLGTTGAGSQNLGVYSEGSASGGTVSTNVTDLPTNGATTYVRLFRRFRGTGKLPITPTPKRPGIGQRAALSAAILQQRTITGTGSDSCAVKLSAPAGKRRVDGEPGQQRFRPDRASHRYGRGQCQQCRLTAMATSVTAAQSATITATLSATTANYALQLDPEQTTGGTPALSLSAETLAFGDVTVGTAPPPAGDADFLGKRRAGHHGRDRDRSWLQHLGRRLPCHPEPRSGSQTAGEIRSHHKRSSHGNSEHRHQRSR